MKSIISRFL